MPKENFVLVSLNESKTKELAQAISNESCRKILDYLAENHDATESDLSKLLSIPISTVHYNMRILLAGGLVSAKEFHYSEKGKEVLHYHLANKYIIIAPKTTRGIKEKLKNLFSVFLLAVAGAGLISLYEHFLKSNNIAALQTFNNQEAISRTADVAEGAVAEAAKAAVEKAPETVTAVQGAVASEQNIALWFLLGSLFVIILIAIIEIIRSRKNNSAY